MRPIDIRKYKQELRLNCRAKRQALSSEEKSTLDRLVAENVRRLKEYRPAKTLLIYMSTPIEVDTVQIIKNAWADGKRVAVPRCIPDSRDMEFHYIDSLECLAPGTFSVLEPDPSLPVVDDFTGCLMIVPGM
ncbi:MAG: 5-formyltetrahydrofolate cyclo-ligase, partial [Clostridia bacterium]|nr:5-formyltetrahydrofolate cyclo-ligase [Clostridia bacterium]